MVRLATEAMATRFEIAIWDERDEVQLKAIAERAVEVIQYWHARLNLFDQASLCGHIARMESGNALRLDLEESMLVESCLEWWKISHGAYDIVVSGARKRGEEAHGTSADLALASDGTFRVARSGLRLDFGSVAKGFALDMVRVALMEEEVACAFVHGGTSSVMTIGVPRDQERWKVRVGDRTIELDGDFMGCLSVSRPIRGSLQHISDARTGGTSDVDASLIAAVIGSSGLHVEGWSTLLLLDPDRRHEYDSMIREQVGDVVYARAT
jgi:thiamine biosynthesis lipoprotein ApbE